MNRRNFLKMIGAGIIGMVLPPIPMPTFAKPQPQKIGWLIYDEIEIRILNDKAFECLLENVEVSV